MYEAKRTGRNRVCYFTHSLQERARFKLCVSKDLRFALGTDQLKLHFQPIVDLATGQITKAEALLRWEHPSRGAVCPAEFIPVAEECGLIVDVSNWIAETVSRWSERLVAIAGPSFQISINKSPTELAAEPSNGAYSHYMNEASVHGGSLCIEITEGVRLSPSTAIIQKLEAYRSAGIQIAIDDFGTGYSSMSYLQRFDVDFLKIDKSFVHNVTTMSADRTIVAAIISMAHKLGVRAVAEGIETDGQRRLLLDEGCDFGQGYLFSKPMAGDDLEALLTQH